MIRNRNEKAKEIMMKMKSKDDDCYEMFKQRLSEELDLRIALVEITPGSESCYAVKNGGRVPYLRIYTLGDSYEKIIGEPARMGLADSESSGHIRMLWERICTEYNLDQSDFFDAQMYIGVGRFETLCFAEFAYGCKDMVSDYLFSKIKIRPKGVYASSTPGINIVYETTDYLEADIEAQKEILVGGIKQLATQHVKGLINCDLSCNLNITFWHPQMPGYHGYFIARED